MWQPIETAPKDGQWILLEGEMDGGDTSCVKIGRWEPTTSSTGTYEWRMLDRSFAGFDEPAAVPEWNWYPEGRVSGWMPLPEPPEDDLRLTGETITNGAELEAYFRRVRPDCFDDQP